MRSFAVIGLGGFGFSIVRTLSENGAHVIAIDKDLEKVQSVRDVATQAVQLNAIDEKSLKAVGITDIDVVVVSVGDDMEASILITMILKQLGIKEVIAKAVNDVHAKVLEKIGASRIVFPEKEMGARLANSLIVPNIFEYIALSKKYSIVEIAPPIEIVGKSIRDAQIRSNYHIEVIAVREAVEGAQELTLNVVPDADYVIKANDKLIVIGRKDYLEGFSV